MHAKQPARLPHAQRLLQITDATGNLCAQGFDSLLVAVNFLSPTQRDRHILHFQKRTMNLLWYVGGKVYTIIEKTAIPGRYKFDICVYKA